MEKGCFLKKSVVSIISTSTVSTTSRFGKSLGYPQVFLGFKFGSTGSEPSGPCFGARHQLRNKANHAVKLVRDRVYELIDRRATFGEGRMDGS